MSRGSHVALLVSLHPPFSLFYLFCFLSSIHQYLLRTLFLWTLKTESPPLSLPVTHSFWAVFCGMAEPHWSQGTGWCRNTNQLTESRTAALNRQIIHVWLVRAETWQVDIKPDCVVVMLMCSSSSFLVVQQHNNYVCSSSSLVQSHNFSNYGSHSCEPIWIFMGPQRIIPDDVIFCSTIGQRLGQGGGVFGENWCCRHWTILTFGPEWTWQGLKWRSLPKQRLQMCRLSHCPRLDRSCY